MKRKYSRILSSLYFLCIISCVLLCGYLVSDTWARYFTEGGGEDSAKVANWDVEVTSVSNSYSESDTAPTVTYVFNVENNSEVAMNCFVKITFDIAPSAHIKLRLQDQLIECDGVSKSYEFGGIMHNAAETKEHTLTVEIQYIDGGKLFDFEKLPTNAGITVSAEQMD